ncbi:hypothetical protein LCGC14_2618210 [marine sediment metagenome]|uniref:Uncharacterized protein n=1 Tax=marine sediment metagenome TaxID=412755 RepID=A0A0F9A440_9ZZZZ
MKIKVGDKVYDSSKEPVMVIFDQSDKESISNMAPVATMYCAFPEGTTQKDATKWVKARIELEGI